MNPPGSPVAGRYAKRPETGRLAGWLLGLLCAGALWGASPGAAAAGGPAWKNSVGMEFVRIPAGAFVMGAPGMYADSPPHRVKIRRAFYLGKTEVTQEQWAAVMGGEPKGMRTFSKMNMAPEARFKGPKRPAVGVSWNDAQEFVARLNRKEGTNKYRLPTEAEWEYACRAGATGEFSFEIGPAPDDVYWASWR
ncbi:MAG: formylglycine-generating enzyme family protein, partial [Candidatus Accumulibacter sp.]|nr:formylglycine-generating enzyme family protein [Accumulibacter sp.]